jgi:diguanylate cyclase (GGDEF)-like protein
VYFIRYLPSVLICSGPRVQLLLASRNRTTAFGERRRKHYSLLPYGSMVIAFAALIVVMPGGVDARLWGVVVGLGLICMLVAGRQLAAFHDNNTLIKKLDATLAELRDHEARLRHQALSDGLTGLANRTHFHDEVAAALAAGHPDGIAVLLVDLDGFKAVNDTMGHAAGDALLVGVAERLRGSTRAGDVVARPGGDEFAVLLPGCGEPEAERTADRILAAFTVPVDIDGTPVCANASIGVAYAEPPEEVGALLRRADMAMYEAKSQGKGTWRRYRPEMENGSATIGAR